MTTEKADVLARHGNVAVVHMSGRRFPAITIQGDTFSTLVALASAIAARAAQMGDAELRDDAGYLRERLEETLQVYETTLGERGIELPYVRSAPPDSDNRNETISIVEYSPDKDSNCQGATPRPTGLRFATSCADSAAGLGWVRTRTHPSREFLPMTSTMVDEAPLPARRRHA